MSQKPINPVRGSIETPFGKLCYQYYGDKKSPVMICCNAFLMDMGSWGRLLPHMMTHTDILIFDFLGQGISDNPKNSSAPSVNENTEYLKVIIDQLEIKDLPLYILGIASGGFIGLEFVKNYPGIIKKLILMGTPIDYSIQLQLLATVQLELLKTNQMRTFVNMFYSLIYGQNFLGSINSRLDELRDRFLEKYVGKNIIIHNIALKMHEYMLSITEKSYKKIDLPILYIYGEEDIISLKSSIVLREAMLPKAKFVSVPSAGHFPIIEKQKDFFNIIDKFL